MEGISQCWLTTSDHAVTGSIKIWTGFPSQWISNKTTHSLFSRQVCSRSVQLYTKIYAGHLPIFHRLNGNVIPLDEKLATELETALRRKWRQCSTNNKKCIVWVENKWISTRLNPYMYCQVKLCKCGQRANIFNCRVMKSPDSLWTVLHLVKKY